MKIVTIMRIRVRPTETQTATIIFVGEGLDDELELATVGIEVVCVIEADG